MSVTVVRGLRDGTHTGGTAFLLRKIRALGAEVKLAKTGRVTVWSAGVTRVYALDLDLTVDPTRCDSPLTRAYRDLLDVS